MAPGTHQSFPLTNVVANPVLVPLLKSRAGRRLGRRLAVVEYVGRRSGRRHRLVTQYARAGRTIRIQVGAAEHKTWWRNFLTAQPVQLHLAGQDHAAVGHAERAEERVTVVAELDGHAP